MKPSLFNLQFRKGQLTHDQVSVLERIKDLAVLYFNDVAQGCAIEPRLWPLIVGPTGCGKSFLARQLARYMGAHYLHITYGDWIVQGARSTCTQFSILDAALRHPRVVVHLDELDKLPARGEQEWARAVVNEIWATLDLEFPVARFAADASAREQHSAEALRALCATQGRGRIFIVGSGTWQDLFDQACTTKSAVGFGATARATPDFHSALARVTATGGPMAELLARFDGAVQMIRPPTLPEALSLLERIGARDYARQISYDEVLTLQTLMPRQGFRALQSVVTELMLRGWKPRGSGKPSRPVQATAGDTTDTKQKEFEF